MRSSVKLAFIFLTIAFLWILSGKIFFSSEETPQEEPPIDPKVTYKIIQKESYRPQLTLRGLIHPYRSISLKSQTSGQVSFIARDSKNKQLDTGHIIARLHPQERSFKIQEAEAKMHQKEAEYKAGEKLHHQGFRSTTNLSALKADYYASIATLKTLENDLSYTIIKAPFEGMIESFFVQEGDYLTSNKEICQFITLYPLKITVHLTNKERLLLQENQKNLTIKINKQSYNVTIDRAAFVADEKTHTYQIDLLLQDHKTPFLPGMAVEVHIPLTPTQAFPISSSYITLSEDGQIGIKYIDDHQYVRFQPITFLNEDEKDFWIENKDQDQLRLITIGHEFVNENIKVQAYQDKEKPQTVFKTFKE